MGILPDKISRVMYEDSHENAQDQTLTSALDPQKFFEKIFKDAKTLEFLRENFTLAAVAQSSSYALRVKTPLEMALLSRMTSKQWNVVEFFKDANRSSTGKGTRILWLNPRENCQDQLKDQVDSATWEIKSHDSRGLGDCYLITKSPALHK